MACRKSNSSKFISLCCVVIFTFQTFNAVAWMHFKCDKNHINIGMHACYMADLMMKYWFSFIHLSESKKKKSYFFCKSVVIFNFKQLSMCETVVEIWLIFIHDTHSISHTLSRSARHGQSHDDEINSISYNSLWCKIQINFLSVP